ncbi:MAG TPA: prolyl oligopeptidase family serine peptidase [Gaiellaceae bacterium]|nr:prolyl oligopeptidase family serine peptidase [Gaiellaceae bacterium]
MGGPRARSPVGHDSAEPREFRRPRARAAQPPILVIHGENDLLVPASHPRDVFDRMRIGSSRPAEYVVLPGGHHDFDLSESIRSNAVSIAVERFIAAARC